VGMGLGGLNIILMGGGGDWALVCLRFRQVGKHRCCEDVALNSWRSKNGQDIIRNAPHRLAGKVQHTAIPISVEGLLYLFLSFSNPRSPPLTRATTSLLISRLFSHVHRLQNKAHQNIPFGWNCGTTALKFWYPILHCQPSPAQPSSASQPARQAGIQELLSALGVINLSYA
jgi:hypothetical protein